jgi:hypothetical protein
MAPKLGLTLGPGGVLCGTTKSGGPGEIGNVFVLTP